MAPEQGPRISVRAAIIMVIVGGLWLLIFNFAPPPPGMVHGQGTVVDQEISSKGLCEPIAEVVIDGTTYRTPPGTSDEPCAYELGESIAVTYYPDNIPETLEIPLEGSSKKAVALLPWVGIALVAGGVVPLVGHVARRRASRS
ncbi:hypothetical protein [Paenarthrobacter sp. NCHU4564]|uniref:hypothetical protein n=1 Tax=Paenarthrobacter sp. NCHU4564 TaxID=3451353 RepID=UPI003F9B5FAC